MPTLKIWGWGKWLHLTDLDQSTAKKYAESGSISESENDELDDVSDGYGFGFNADSIVIVNDKEIGTVMDILEKSKGTDRYEYIESNLSIPAIHNVQNAWLKEETYKGTFVEIDIEEDCVDSNGVTDKFYQRFIENIGLEDTHTFNLSEWSGVEVFQDDIDCKGVEFYVVYNGETFELGIEDCDDS